MMCLHTIVKQKQWQGMQQEYHYISQRKGHERSSPRLSGKKQMGLGLHYFPFLAMYIHMDL